MRLRAVRALVLAYLLAACSGGGGGRGAPPGMNSAPVFTSSTSASVAENAASAFFTATASDPDGDALTYSIAGGADAARFAIDAMNGALNFVAPPDFEAPADADGDNVYQVTLGVFDGALSASSMLAVTVTDIPGVMGVRRVGMGFSEPLFVVGKGDGTGRVFVVERGGRIRILNPATGAIAAQHFLDVSAEISTDGERGLLGMALAPDFATRGTFYVFLTNPAGDIEIRRYASSGDAATGVGDVIMVVPHPGASNHNGGWLGFGPDGLLYIAIGDGGGAGDPNNNGQNPDTLLGVILRIDPSTDAFPADDRDYSIPPGNPFAGGGGAPEIWLYGLRNPFRASFDRATGDLYIGDVGQGAVEEIDLARANDGGRNYGWNVLEGTQPYPPGSPPPANPALYTSPIAQYPHGGGALQGNSVTGGYVYRGPIASLRGHYVFGDFINSRIWSIPVSSIAQGATIPNTQFTDRTAAFAPDVGAIGNIASFGEDDAGNLYIIDFGGEVFAVLLVE